MELLWVISVDLFACFADLLGNDEVGGAFDDSLDLGLFVTRDQNKVVALTRDAFVLRPNDVDRLEAGGLPAFAVDANLGRDAMPLCALLDSLVDPAEDLLVPCRALGEFHVRSLPDEAVPTQQRARAAVLRVSFRLRPKLAVPKVGLEAATNLPAGMVSTGDETADEKSERTVRNIGSLTASLQRSERSLVWMRRIDSTRVRKPADASLSSTTLSSPARLGYARAAQPPKRGGGPTSSRTPRDSCLERARGRGRLRSQVRVLNVLRQP
jgi:hypothetical protein